MPPSVNWNSTAITPGTSFMNNLGEYITKYYKNKEGHYNVEKIIGNGLKTPTRSELKNKKIARKSIVASQKILKAIYGLR